VTNVEMKPENINLKVKKKKKKEMKSFRIFEVVEILFVDSRTGMSHAKK
jgi:hypothetical protein